MSDSGPRPRTPELEAVQALLASMGISPADLADPPPGPRDAPDFATYISRVAGAVSPGTRRVYGSYWDKVVLA